MPETAAFIDGLRKELGQAYVDKLLIAGKQGKPGCYFAEVGPDGVLREFGTPASRRAQVVDGELTPLPAQQGWPVPADLLPNTPAGAGGVGVSGSSRQGGSTGDSSRAQSVLRGPLKGVK
jgi:hypothetical protein